jgi:hypothetical protein
MKGMFFVMAKAYLKQQAFGNPQGQTIQIGHFSGAGGRDSSVPSGINPATCRAEVRRRRVHSSINLVFPLPHF